MRATTILLLCCGSAAGFAVPGGTTRLHRPALRAAPASALMQDDGPKAAETNAEAEVRLSVHAATA